MTKNPSDLAIWLKFISDIAWPVAAVAIVLVFRRPLRSLFDRVSSFKMAGTEMAFQQPSPDISKTETSIKTSDLVDKGFGTFLSETGIRGIVRDRLDHGDEVYRAILIFSTDRQATWVLFSKQQVFCVLDDETARTSGRLIQWAIPRQTARPVHARETRPGVGTVDIGPRRNWLYSTRLFPTPRALEVEIQGAVDEGKLD